MMSIDAMRLTMLIGLGFVVMYAGVIALLVTMVWKPGA